MEPTPIPFVPETATREEWDRFHAYGRSHREELGQTGGPVTDRVRETYMQGMAWEVWMVEIDDRIVSVRYFRVREGDRLQMSGGLLREFRRCGIGTTWLRTARDRMVKEGVDLLETKSHRADEAEFLAAVGFEHRTTQGHSRLEIADIDRDMVGEWAKGAIGTVRFSLYPDRLPDAALRDYMSIRNRFPELGTIRETEAGTRENLERVQGPDGLHHTILTREEDGAVSGMTETIWYPDRPRFAMQEFTGVAPAHRGRGIAKALKARMLEYILERHPEVTTIGTTNETSNAPVMSINERLGFQRTKETTEHRITRAALEDWLASR